jgi:hypothetical protein
MKVRLAIITSKSCTHAMLGPWGTYMRPSDVDQATHSAPIMTVQSGVLGCYVD